MDQDKLNEIKKFLSLNSLKKERFVFPFIDEKKFQIFVLFLGFFISFFLSFYIAAPKEFPTDSIYNLRSGYTYGLVAQELKENKIIQSPFWFKTFVAIFTFGERKVIAGDYSMTGRQNVITLAWRVSQGDFKTSPLKITIPEGLNSYEIADIFYKYLPFFDKKNFLVEVQTRKLEGYLFPDTYFLMPSAKENDVIKLLNDNFKEKIKTLEGDIKKFGKSESDVVKMASILEGEARLFETRQIVSGILWKRISIGMALQVDSSFKYINGKATHDLTLDDLKIDSPYNSYTNRGLPPTPISNPGLEAIKAAISPIKTPYLYFLTDKDGNMHYAITLEEHAANKSKYLR